MTERIYLYDCTLRDGAQTQGVDFSVADKLAIAEALDRFGIDYVEGGWPGANPTDSAFFADPPSLRHARFTAFGMTKRSGRSASNDPGLAALLSTKAPTLCLVGKSWDFQVDVEYACRWWQECGFKSLKSALFDWERGRVTEPARVAVRLIGISCALWAMWLLGRAHEHIPKRKATTTKPQQRRKSIIKQGSTAFKHASKKKRSLIMPIPPIPRVLDYERIFGQLAQNHVMQ
jgi:hypothetical protein